MKKSAPEFYPILSAILRNCLNYESAKSFTFEKNTLFFF